MSVWRGALQVGCGAGRNRGLPLQALPTADWYVVLSAGGGPQGIASIRRSRARLVQRCNGKWTTGHSQVLSGLRVADRLGRGGDTHLGLDKGGYQPSQSFKRLRVCPRYSLGQGRSDRALDSKPTSTEEVALSGDVRIKPSVVGSTLNFTGGTLNVNDTGNWQPTGLSGTLARIFHQTTPVRLEIRDSSQSWAANVVCSLDVGVTRILAGPGRPYRACPSCQ
jgi:hypothetical protein